MEARPEGNRGRILFADDDRAAREGLAEMLRRHGYDCATAANAAEAIEKLRAGGFEALISDIHMPGNTSLELVESAAQTATPTDGRPQKCDPCSRWCRWNVP